MAESLVVEGAARCQRHRCHHHRGCPDCGHCRSPAVAAALMEAVELLAAACWMLAALMAAA